MNNNVLKNLIDGLGAVAELSKITFDAYIKAGFKHSDALELTIAAQEVMLTEAFRKGETD